MAHCKTIAAACLCLLTTLVAELGYSADGSELLYGYSATISGVYEGGATDYSAFRSNYGIAPRGVGVRYSERNGIISGTTVGIGIGLLIAIAGVAKATGPKSTETWRDDKYRYTKMTFYSESEKAEINARTARVGSEAGGLFAGSATQGFDLVLYSRNLGGDATGFHATMTLLSFWETATSRFDVGVMFGSISTATQRDGLNLLTHAPSGGLPFRYYQVFGPVLTYAELDWNFYANSKPSPDVATGQTLAQQARGNPWRVGAQTVLFRRLYLEAAATSPALLSGQLGFSTSVGARF